jgi:hypothetical protein
MKIYNQIVFVSVIACIATSLVHAEREDRYRPERGVVMLATGKKTYQPAPPKTTPAQAGCMQHCVQSHCENAQSWQRVNCQKNCEELCEIGKK